MEKIYCFAKTPPDADEDAFEGVETNNVLLFVPYGSEDLYKAHDFWKRFWVETPTGVDEIEGGRSKMEDNNPVYNLSGQQVGKPQKGINIIRYSDGTTRKVLIK